MTKEEKKELNDLLNYVKNNILYYSDTQKTPPFLKKKINELALGEDGVFNYTYKMILYSFMINKNRIEYAFNTKTFKTEKHKINYMMVVVANSMNDIKKKVNLNKKIQEQKNQTLDDAQYLAENNLLHGRDNYVRKTIELRSDEIDKLW